MLSTKHDQKAITARVSHSAVRTPKLFHRRLRASPGELERRQRMNADHAARLAVELLIVQLDVSRGLYDRPRPATRSTPP